MRSLFQIEIPKRAHVCAKGNEALLPEMDYFSTLVKDEEKGFLRQDFCVSCWEMFMKEESIHQGRSHWKSKVFPKKEIRITAENRDERVLELLKETLAKSSEEDAAESFVLALYLARRRLIALRQEVKQEDGTAMLYEIYDTEEMLCIKKQQLSSLEIEKIQQSIAKKLKEQ